MAHLARIQIFPIKSLDPVVLQEARVLSVGGIEFDRRWQIVDDAGKRINGKRTPRVHQIRTTFDARFERATLACDGREATFTMATDLDALEAWLAEAFGQPVRVLENPRGGFPDDTNSPGPTVLTTSTLQTVASWFPPMSLESARWRFRANLEIGDVEPFWDDRIVGPAGTEIAFRVGELVFAGTNPCQRCPVPSRDPRTGEAIDQFHKEFTQQREAALPDWAERSRFNHYYRLAVNTRLVSGGGTIHVGDPVSLV